MATLTLTTSGCSLSDGTYFSRCSELESKITRVVLEDRWAKPSHEILVSVSNPLDRDVVLYDFIPTCGCATPRFVETCFLARESKVIKLELNGLRLAEKSPKGGEVSLTPLFKDDLGGNKINGASIQIKFGLMFPAELKPSSVLLSPNNSQKVEVSFLESGFRVGKIVVPKWLLANELNDGNIEDGISKFEFRVQGDLSSAPSSLPIELPIENSVGELIGTATLVVQLVLPKSIILVPDIFVVENGVERDAKATLAYRTDEWPDMEITDITTCGIKVVEAKLEKDLNSCITFRYSGLTEIDNDIPAKCTFRIQDRKKGHVQLLDIHFLYFSR